jgi:hypothetical protein
MIVQTPVPVPLIVDRAGDPAEHSGTGSVGAIDERE